MLDSFITSLLFRHLILKDNEHISLSQAVGEFHGRSRFHFGHMGAECFVKKSKRCRKCC